MNIKFDEQTNLFDEQKNIINEQTNRINEFEQEGSNWKISQEWISCYNHWVEMELMKALKQVQTLNPGDLLLRTNLI